MRKLIIEILVDKGAVLTRWSSEFVGAKTYPL